MLGETNIVLVFRGKLHKRNNPIISIRGEDERDSWKDERDFYTGLG